MFNSVNNPFSKAISSSTSSDSNGKRQKEDPKKELKKYLEEDEADEVRLGGMPILSEDEIKSMVSSYINKLKEENKDREKVVEKLDKFLEKFDVQKFMKRNPNMTSPDFYMVMYNETESIIKWVKLLCQLGLGAMSCHLKDPLIHFFLIEFFCI